MLKRCDNKSLERATCIRFNAARSSGGCHLELARASPRRAGQPVQRAEDGFTGGAQSISRNAGAVSAHSEFHDFMMGNSRSEEHTSELQSLMRISYAVFCLNKTT